MHTFHSGTVFGFETEILFVPEDDELFQLSFGIQPEIYLGVPVNASVRVLPGDAQGLTHYILN